MKPWTLYFDGLTEPTNPGGWMCCGWVLDADGHLVTGKKIVVPETTNTNNVSEYLALYYGLLEAQKRRDEHPDKPYPGIFIKGDSQLVVRQMEKLWQVKHPRMMEAHARCLKLALALGPYVIEWVPRDQNQLADKLSREAYFDATGKVPVERRKKA